MMNIRFLGYSLTFIILFAVDRIAKSLMFSYGYSTLRITPFLSFHLSFNRGISWGMFHSDKTIPFVIVSLMIVAVIIGLFIHLLIRLNHGFSVWGETIALAGAISNLVDRFLYGGVLDFISFSFSWFSWPVFNFADFCIVFGIFFIFLGFRKEG